MSGDLHRNTNGSCATTRKPNDSTETCGLGDNAVLMMPISTKQAYQMNAVVLTSSIPAKKAAAVTAEKMKRLQGVYSASAGQRDFLKKDCQHQNGGAQHKAGPGERPCGSFC